MRSRNFDKTESRCVKLERMSPFVIRALRAIVLICSLRPPRINSYDLMLFLTLSSWGQSNLESTYLESIIMELNCQESIHPNSNILQSIHLDSNIVQSIYLESTCLESIYLESINLESIYLELIYLE